MLAPLLEDTPHRLEHHDDRSLVVAAEDRAGAVPDDAVVAHDGLDRGNRRDCVGVRAEEDRHAACVVRRRDTQ
jgi:hypothetical protein